MTSFKFRDVVMVSDTDATRALGIANRRAIIVGIVPNGELEPDSFAVSSADGDWDTRMISADLLTHTGEARVSRESLYPGESVRVASHLGPQIYQSDVDASAGVNDSVGRYE